MLEIFKTTFGLALVSSFDINIRGLFNDKAIHTEEMFSSNLTRNLERKISLPRVFVRKWKK